MLEIIATTQEDARRIGAAGADRIELVSALSEGGLTPSHGMIRQVLKETPIPVNVMIRPHAKSFVYDKDDLAVMKEDILLAQDLGANGVVLGALDEERRVCRKTLERLLLYCGRLHVTFHRAIDEAADLVEGVRILAGYPEITSVLTSGGRGNILEQLDVIQEMVEQAGKIRVLVGGGLTLDNIRKVMKETGAPDFHFGTAVRKGRSPLGEIDTEKLRHLVVHMKER